MSSQTIYFDNPAVITQHTQQITSMSGSVSQLQQQVGTTPNLPNVSTMTRYINYLNSQLSCTKSTGAASNMTGAPTANTDLNGQAWKGYCTVIGNAFSGQRSSFATGTCTPAGAVPTADTLHQLGSQTKILGGLAMVKMMEEGYFTPTETINKYFSPFGGIGYAYVTGTGTLGNSYVATPNFSNMSGTLTQVNLSNLTIAQAMAYQIPHPYGLTSIGQLHNSTLWTLTTTAYPNPDWGMLNMYANSEVNLPVGLALGATGACQLYSAATAYAVTGSIINGYQIYNVTPGSGALRMFSYNNFYGDFNYCTGPFIDQLNTAINCIKSAVIPMAWVPGSQALSQENIYSPKSGYYDFSSLLMQAVMAGALKAKQGTTGFPAAGTYPTLISYIRAKLLAPLGMNNTNSFFGFCEQAPNAPTWELSFRRSYILCTGYYSDMASPSYVSGGVNRLVYTSQYPDDGLSNFATGSYAITNDPIGPRLVSDFFASHNSFANILVMVANKGVFNGTRVLNRSSINYLLGAVSAAGIGIFEFTSGIYDYCGPACHWMLGFGKVSSEFANVAQLAATVNNTGLPEQSTARLVGALPQGLSPSCIFWFGSGGSSYILDLDTGNYITMANGQMTYGTAANGATPDATVQYQYLNQYV